MSGRIRLPFTSINPFDAVPLSTPLILDIQQLPLVQNNLDSTLYHKDFSKDFMAKKVGKDLKQIQRIFRNNGSVQSLLKEQRILAALQVGGAQQLDFLYVLAKKEGRFSESELSAALGAKNRSSSSTFRRKKIYQWRAPKGSRQNDFVFCVYRNLLLAAPYSFLIEDAISQLKQPQHSILGETGFSDLMKNTEPGNFQVYIALHKIPSAFSTYFKNNYKGMLANMEKAFSWLRFTVKPEETQLILDGIMVKPAHHRLLQNLAANNSGEIGKLAEVLPDNTAVFTWLNFEDWQSFYRARDDLDEEFQFYFHPWLGKDFAYVITEPYSKGLAAEKFAVFRVADPDLAKHYLEKFSEQKGELKNFDYQNFRIRQVLADNLLKPIFGEAINGIHNPFYTQLGDYLIFSNSRQSLEVWIDKYLVGQTLSRDDRFLIWQNDQHKPANGLFYIEPSYASNLLLSFLKEDVARSFREQLNPYLKFNQYAFSLSPVEQDAQIAVDAQFSYGEKKENQTTIMWKTALMDTIVKAPKVFYNPRRQAHEIIVQDQSNTVYLLSQSGEVLWEKRIEEDLLSSIFTIDFYRNGHVQYLFNTPNAIYLLDDEGKDVGTFPIPLKSRATNGVVVVDFQKRKEYAYFLACENGNVYGYSQLGKPLPGWNPQARQGLVRRPLQHFVYKNQDYLLVLNDRGQLSAFKRDGSRRFSPTKLNAIMTGPMGVDFADNKMRVVGSDERGRLYVLNRAGDLFHLNMSVGKNEHVEFCFADVLGEAKKDYIGLSEKDLTVYSYTKDGDFAPLMNYTYQLAQDSIFEVQVPAYSQSMIGSMNKESHQINLIDGEGKNYPGFPLAGNSAFEVTNLFGNEQKILVVAFDESVYVYKLY